MDLVEERIDKKLDAKLDSRFADFSDTMEKKFEQHTKTINANVQSQIAQLRKDVRVQPSAR